MVSIIFVLAGCQRDADKPWHVELIDPHLVDTGEGIDVVSGVVLEPSPAMVEALDRGVPVTLSVQTRATRGPVYVPAFDRLRKHRLEITYLPLSRHYQLEYLREENRTTYPRLSMLMNDLQTPREWSVKIEPEEFADDDWRIQARVEVDRSRLPSPMRLPSWLDPQWRLYSDWREWSSREAEAHAP